MDGLYVKVYIFVIIVLSAVFHEYAHGLVAYKLGDDTAKRSGRLTLNPFAHMDLFGTIILPILSLWGAGVFIGWAKPVPYNPYNLSDKKYGSLKVAIAGPSANFIIAIMLGVLIRIFGSIGIMSNIAIEFFAISVYINIFLALFNLIPIPPLDGSKVFMDLFPDYARNVKIFGFFGLFIALMIAFYIIPPIATLIFHILTGLSAF